MEKFMQEVLEKLASLEQGQQTMLGELRTEMRSGFEKVTGQLDVVAKRVNDIGNSMGGFREQIVQNSEKISLNAEQIAISAEKLVDLKKLQITVNGHGRTIKKLEKKVESL